MFKKSLLLALPLALVACGSTNENGNANAEYPEQQISMVVPYAAGGATDAVARILASEVSEELGTNVTVQNIDGGAGTIGMQQVAQAEPDGYTIAMPTSTVLPLQLPYDETTITLEDFDPVAQLYSVGDIVAVDPGSSWETMDDLIEDAKDRPGEISVASTGAGSTADLAATAMMTELGVDFNVIQYGGGGEALTAFLGGHVDVLISANIQEELEAGTLRGLLTFSETPEYEDFPSSTEYGLEFQMPKNAGIVVPSGTPDEVRTHLADAFSVVLNKEEVQEEMIAIGQPPQFLPGDEYFAVVDEQLDIAENLMIESGLIE